MPETTEDVYTPLSFALEERLLRSACRQPASRIPGFITDQQQADRLGVTVSTLRRWRRKGYGPKSVKIGRKDYYPETADAEFAAAQLAEAEAAAEPRGRGRPRK
jgi:hypothetical protein